MLQNAASDQGLHCLPLIHQFLDTSSRSKYGLGLNFRTFDIRSLDVPIFRVNRIVELWDIHGKI